MIWHKRSTVVTVFILALALPGFLIFFLFSDGGADHNLEVQITDFTTSEPVENAKIIIAQSGIGFIGGRFVWGEYYRHTATTDTLGKVTATDLAGKSVFVRADHEDYTSLFGTYPREPTIILKLKRTNPNYRHLPGGNLEVGIEAGRPFGWIFSEKRKTFDPNEADIFPEIRGNSLYITASRGIVFTSKNTIGATNELLKYTDTAPATGYVPEEELDLKSTNGVYFVITQDNTYAKFEFTWSGFVRTGSIQNFRGDNWALVLKYVFNPDSSRNLEYR